MFRILRRAVDDSFAYPNRGLFNYHCLTNWIHTTSKSSFYTRVVRSAWVDHVTACAISLRQALEI